MYIHAGSPNITNLTYNDQSMTLICTSTGGPATTVTWKRDGVVITHNATYQQTKSLVDPVTGTYQTVLTIDPLKLTQWIHEAFDLEIPTFAGDSSWKV